MAVFDKAYLESYFDDQDFEEYITESLTEDESERKAAGKKIKASLDKWLKAYVKSYLADHPTIKSRFRASKYERDMFDATGDIGFSIDDKDFVKGNSNDISFKIRSKYSWIQLPLNIISALLTGYCYVQVGQKAADRAAMRIHVSKNKADIEKSLSNDTGYDCSIKMGDKNKTVIVTCKDKK